MLSVAFRGRPESVDNAGVPPAELGNASGEGAAVAVPAVDAVATVEPDAYE